MRERAAILALRRQFLETWIEEAIRLLDELHGTATLRKAATWSLPCQAHPGSLWAGFSMTSNLTLRILNRTAMKVITASAGWQEDADYEQGVDVPG